MKNSILLLVLICSFGLLSACGGGASGGQVGGGGNQIVVATNPNSPQSIDMNQSDPISATVTGDSSGKGVNWSVSCPMAVNACGGMMQTSTPSGAPNVYNAPPNTASPETITVTATSMSDSSKFAKVMVTVNPTLTLVNPPPAQPQPGIVGQQFSFGLEPFVQGGSAPFNWTMKSGTLPAGLSLAASTGMISGTPTAATAAGAKKPAQSAAPASSAAAATIVFTCTDSGIPNISTDVQISITINSQSGGALAITSGPPPNGTVGQSYGGTQIVFGNQFTGFPLNATGGTGPYSWTWAAATGSSLPTGLNISTLSFGGSTRCCVTVVVIHGTPSVAETFHVVVTVTDSASPPTTFAADYTIIVTGTAVAANPVPFINQPLSPGSKAPAGGSFSLTVDGTNFVAGSVVKWNGSTLATNLLSKSQLTATVPASDITAANTASVTVENPAPGGGSSNVVYFETTPPSSSIAFGAPTELTTDSSPLAVATGDFNGDGKLDLAVTNDVGDVSILLGKGDGTFLPAVNYGTGPNPSSVIVGDFNGDGKLDLVISDAGDQNVSVLLGNGDGTFRPFVGSNTGSGSTALAMGDFNGDGKLDLAIPNASGGNSVIVLLGNGDGTFQPPSSYAVGPTASSVVTGDFNGDGKLDLAVTNFTGGSVSLLLGNGDGTFQAAVNYGTGSGPQSVVAGDFDGDGKLDLAVANAGGNNISILLGNGDGTFQPAVDYAAGQVPISVTVADLNGDGKLDAVISTLGNNGVTVLLGKGDGTFQPAVPFGATTNGHFLAVGDFNNDGRLDLAMSGASQSAISVFLQETTIALSAPSVNFNTQLVNTSSSLQAVTLTNSGGVALKFTGISITGANSGDFSETQNCGSGLAAGASCTINASFTPLQVGPRSATISIMDDSSGSPQTVALIGTGLTSGANATLLPTSLTFAPQLLNSTSGVQTVTLGNYGTTAINISSITASANFADTQTCPTSLAAGATCPINLTFVPTTTGNLTGTISVKDSAPGSPQSIPLNGIGAAETTATINPVEVALICVASVINSGCSPPANVTLTNTGASPLYIQGITISPVNFFSQTNNCSSSLQAGQSCVIAVSFDGPASRDNPGKKTYMSTLSVNDTAAGSPQQVLLTGITNAIP